ncbi:DUF814 domain-containing protein [Candidatus Woesearchaeota archaeon]|nr:DUF814 domain-containing protein [Candidatus Woesearchaeota archaeon]
MKITINPKLSVEQNAEEYFEKAKQARKKLEGAKKALAISLKKREAEQQSRDEKLEKIKAQHKAQAEKVERKAEWYEKFRWFFSSEGFLVIGGRDATTNEIVVKKHTEKHDIVFHTDMSGSPFFVVKTEGKEPGEQTLHEAADATLCFSKAWKMGLGTTATFWVRPEQVTKEANPGEYLPKGAFMIRGRTNYLTPTPNCAIGVMDDGRLMCGPKEAVRKNCKKAVTIIQGDRKPSDLAKEIRKKLGGDIDGIMKVLPAGGCAIKE